MIDTVQSRHHVSSKIKHCTSLVTLAQSLPASSTDTSPPSCWAAVIVLYVNGMTEVLLCSAMTRLLANRVQVVNCWVCVEQHLAFGKQFYSTQHYQCTQRMRQTTKNPGSGHFWRAGLSDHVIRAPAIQLTLEQNGCLFTAFFQVITNSASLTQ